MYEEASLHRYGTPLPPIEEDAVPSKKPVRPEDQIVTDENGKRRFHGAFTGGFSAGYWNTVGSQEGWTPASFKSSRAEKAPARTQQRPEDFMDSEDLGEFGIAPKHLQPRADYTQGTTQQQVRKRRVSFCAQPIPGEPVLAQLLRPRELKIGERILQTMGWRQGEGIGPRLNPRAKQKLRQQRRQEAQLNRVYGAVGDGDVSMESSAEELDMYDAFEDITLAPDDYEPYACKPKADCFGLGYREMLSEDPAMRQHFSESDKARHFNLFEQPTLQIVDKNNRKVNIRGQAFGVGALEDDDEDIYAQEDMTRYDYTLEEKKNPKARNEQSLQQFGVLEGFELGARSTPPVFINVEVPENFIPRNWLIRKSRFAPLEPERAKELEKSFKKIQGRHKYPPVVRGELLEDTSWTTIDTSSTSTVTETSTFLTAKSRGRERQTTQAPSSQSTSSSMLEFLTSSSSDKFQPGETINTRIEETFFTPSSTTSEDAPTPLSKIPLNMKNFQPFIDNPSKQKRYEEFLAADIKTEQDIAEFLNRIQPLAFSEFDRQLEQKEFLQAKAIYKPLEGAMAERFVSGANTHSTKSPEQPAEKPVPREFDIKRSKSLWVPVSLLCKRFNIAEPHGAAVAAKEKASSGPKVRGIFTYLESSVNKRSDFQTPVIIPKALSKLQPVIQEQKQVTATAKTTTIENPTKTKLPDARNALPSTATSANTPYPKPISPTRTVSGVKADTTKQPGRHLPKTELEKRIEETRDKHPWEKLDVFEAVFAESSEDEVEKEDKNKEKPQKPQQKESTATQTTTNTASTSTSTYTLAETQKQNPQSTTNATAVNLLRNTSPPRGIFKALFEDVKKAPKTSEVSDVSTEELKACRVVGTSSDTKILFQPRRERLQMTSATSSTVEVYGPKLPEHIKRTLSNAGDGNDTTTMPATRAINEEQLDDKLTRLLQAHRSAGDIPEEDDDDEWTEKTIGVLRSNREEANSLATSDSSDSSQSSKSSDESPSPSSSERVKRIKKPLKKSIKKKKNKKKKKSNKEIDVKQNNRKSKKKKLKKANKKSKIPNKIYYPFQ